MRILFLLLGLLASSSAFGQTTLVSPVQTKTCPAGEFFTGLSSVAVFACAAPTPCGSSGITGQVCNSTGGAAAAWGQSVIGPDGSGAGAGNDVILKAGAGGATGNGGHMLIDAGTGGATSGLAGGVRIQGGDAGGDGEGGNIQLLSGDSVGANVGAAFIARGGAAGATSGNGGAASVTGGGATVGTGGASTLAGGAAGTGDGGAAAVTGGAVITSGDGGDVILTPGAGAGGGVAGSIRLNGAVIGVVVERSGTTDTLAGTDCGKTIAYTSGSAVAVTLPDSLEVGCHITAVQVGAGQITFSIGGGATLRSAHAYTKTFGQYAGLGLSVIQNSGGSAAVWFLFGDGA